MNECIFCKIAKKEIPSKIIYEDDTIFATLDIDPICDGHILIIPKKHIEDIYEVDDNTLLHMFNIGKMLTTKVNKKFNQNSMTFSINYGEKQLIKHIHLHIMPDYTKKPNLKTDEVYKILMED